MQVLGKHGNFSSHEAIQDMEYIQKIMRKWPPSVSVIIPVYAMHHDPSIYKNPEIFDPSRFDKDNIGTRHPLAFVSFGDGPRNCPGIRFALIEIKICLAKILTNFRLALDETRTGLPLKFAPNKFMICQEEGIYVNFSRL